MRYITDKEIDRLGGAVGEQLMVEPKVQLMIGGNPEDTPWEGGINGYFFRIRRGIQVAVPKSLGELIRQNEQVQLLSEARVRPYKGNRGKKLSE
ncbi:MAG: hypothetical protein EOM66_04245 [Clostridia bacterium]|nr:hypothetical protein [Candidatus Pelethousia sp.]NCB30599.1 hypothetical protein [Clostridia bacterium]